MELPPPTSERLRSLDAYRGFIMLAMASSGFRIESVARALPESDTWQFLGRQLSHVEWVGCSFWDLIQPSFMFMVGVALPYSLASRQARGESKLGTAWHVIYRSLALVCLGIFLSSNSSRQTNFTFVNVLTQIGLGYPFLYLLGNRSYKVHLTAIGAILLSTWLLFYLHPLPPEGFDWKAAKIPDDTGWTTGLFAHWNKHTNFATAWDQWFLRLFPHSEMYPYNKGGYQTLNFLPSLATMIFGLMAGQLLRGPLTPIYKLRALFFAGLWCLAIGYLLSETACPLVKRIWTPSWAVFSSGWAFLMLAGFYGILDVAHITGWETPFVVVGMNSIAMYCMAQLMSGWIGQSFRTHLGSLWGRFLDMAVNPRVRTEMESEFGRDLMSGIYGPIVQSCAVLLVLWLICYWLYRRQVFLKI